MNKRKRSEYSKDNGVSDLPSNNFITQQKKYKSGDGHDKKYEDMKFQLGSNQLI